MNNDATLKSLIHLFVLVVWALKYLFNIASRCLSARGCIWCKDAEKEGPFAGLAIGCIEEGSYTCEEVHEATLEQEDKAAEQLGKVKIRSGYFFSSNCLSLISHY